MKILDWEAVHAQAARTDLATVLQAAFANPAEAPPRTQHAVAPGGTLLIMPAWRSASRTGVKLVTVFPQNTRQGLPSVMAQYMLLSGETGEPQALIDGQALTLVRTAAVSAFAARLLSPSPKAGILVVGAGALAPYLARAHCAAQAPQELMVWARDPVKCASVADELSNEGLPARAVRDLQAAARSADLVCTATFATSPLIRGAWLKPGCHLDLVGSFQPAMREADEVAVARAQVTVDDSAALREAGELVHALATGSIGEADIADLTAALCGEPRPIRGDITVFKSIGAALADLAVAEALVDLPPLDGN